MAKETLKSVKEHAEGLVVEARQHADRLVTEANKRADRLAEDAKSTVRKEVAEAQAELERKLRKRSFRIWLVGGGVIAAVAIGAAVLG